MYQFSLNSFVNFISLNRQGLWKLFFIGGCKLPGGAFPFCCSAGILHITQVLFATLLLQVARTILQAGKMCHWKAIFVHILTNLILYSGKETLLIFLIFLRFFTQYWKTYDNECYVTRLRKFIIKKSVYSHSQYCTKQNDNRHAISSDLIAECLITNV